MGMKSKVRSMQRGALLRSDAVPVTNADLYKVSPPLLTDEEMAHFQFGNRTINDFFLGVSEVLKACHHNHLAAAEVSKVLNTQNARTACGQPWTPRLAWFLMKTWRTVHFHKLEQEREGRKAAERQAVAAKSSEIDRAVARQEAHTFQKVLRNYFKNPTLGEIFPELGALRQTLLSGLMEKPNARTAETDLPSVGSAGTPDAAVKETGPSKRKRPVPDPAAARQASPQPIVFTGEWGAFFRSYEGREYLATLVRAHPRLLELAPEKDIRFLGCLRSRKAAHPIDKYWTEGDAEQVRLALVDGLHRLHRR